MPKIEMYKCDKCGATSKDQMELIFIGRGRSFYDRYANNNLAEYMLCEKCLEKIGAIKRVVKGDEIVNEPQDIKDRLYDIVVELLNEIGCTQ